MAVMYGGIVHDGFLMLHAAFKLRYLSCQPLQNIRNFANFLTKAGQMLSKYPRGVEPPTHGEGCKRDGDEVALLLPEVQAPPYTT